MVFTCTDHAGHWPVGVASVVIADSEAEAHRLLDAELTRRGLKPGHYTLKHLSLIEPRAVVLCDGDY
jgi:hypothetical protein